MASKGAELSGGEAKQIDSMASKGAESSGGKAEHIDSTKLG